MLPSNVLLGSAPAWRQSEIICEPSKATVHRIRGRRYSIFTCRRFMEVRISTIKLARARAAKSKLSC